MREIVNFFIEIGEFLVNNWSTIASVIIGLGIGGAIKTGYTRYKLRKPVEMHFIIPLKKKHEIDYAIQDNEEEHLVDKLILPSNSECLVMIWYRPRINYHEIERYFGCEGDTDVKPIPIKCFSPFIVDGCYRDCSPDKDNKHYRDWWGYYHVPTEKIRLKEETYAGGFIVKTGKANEYEAFSYVQTPIRIGISSLKILVKDEPYEEDVSCIRYKTLKKQTRIKNWILRKPKHNVTFKYPKEGKKKRH